MDEEVLEIEGPWFYAIELIICTFWTSTNVVDKNAAIGEWKRKCG